LVFEVTKIRLIFARSTIMQKRPTLFYRWLKWSMDLVLRFYLQKLHISGLEHIPKQGPFILACNHPNSFLDACIIATFIKRPVHFLVRGDMFINGTVNWLLRQMHQLPIHRREEGLSQLSKNDQTFAECYQLFQQNSGVLIFSEGRSEFEKRLRKIRKGTARLALGALNELDEATDIPIVPVGVNYTYGDQFRTEAILAIGPALSTLAYAPNADIPLPKRVNELTAAIEAALEKRVIILDNDANEKVAELLFPILRNNVRFTHKWKIKSTARFEQEKAIATMVNDLAAHDLPKLTALQGKANDYQALLKSENVSDEQLTIALNGRINIFNLALSFYPFFIGWLTCFPPLLLAKWTTGKRVKLPEFYASVLVALGFFYCLLYIPLLVVLLLFINPALAWLPFFFPLCLVIGRDYWYLHKKWMFKMVFKIKEVFSPKKVQELQSKRKELLDYIHQLTHAPA